MNTARSATASQAAAAAPASRASRVAIPGVASGEVIADVIETGAGSTFTFLHGLVGLNQHWEGVVERVAGTVRCVSVELPLLELRGQDCSIQGVAELTERYLERHIEGPSVLVGNSFGGHVALHIAHRRPELVRGLVLAGSSGLIERTMVRGAPVRPSRDWLVEKIGELFFDKRHVSPGDIDRAHALLNSRGGARAMVRLSKTARRNHMGEHLSEIACPALLVWGREDVVTPPSAAQGFLDLLPDARIAWIDKCGHAPMIEAPGAFAEALLVF
ncbi:MAG: alpha/beta hydrolase, partial [Planctomycetota bacterium]